MTKRTDSTPGEALAARMVEAVERIAAELPQWIQAQQEATAELREFRAELREAAGRLGGASALGNLARLFGAR